jgi:hypothetical protein
MVGVSVAETFDVNVGGATRYAADLFSYVYLTTKHGGNGYTVSVRRSHLNL